MSPHRRSAVFALTPRKAVLDLVFVMVWLEVLVVVLDVWLDLSGVVPSTDLRRLFDATSERGIGSWISVTQTGLIALTLGVTAAVHRATGAPRLRWAGWLALAVFFSYLTFDDATQFHERVGTAFAESEASEGGLGQFPSYYWQVLFGPFFLTAGLLMAAFLWREFRSWRLRLLVGGAFALLALAVALDFIDGLGPGHPWNAYERLVAWGDLDARTQAWFGMSGLDAVVHLSRAVEESTEMLAMTLLWAAFLLHLTGTTEQVEVRWARADEPAPRSARVQEPRPAPSRRHRTGATLGAFGRRNRRLHGTDAHSA